MSYFLFNFMKIKQVACGGFFTAVLLDSGTLYVFKYCWLYVIIQICGDNNYNQHGKVSKKDEDIPGFTELEILRHRVSTVTLGFAYVIVTLVNGEIWGWGTGEFGTLLQVFFNSFLCVCNTSSQIVFLKIIFHAQCHALSPIRLAKFCKFRAVIQWQLG